MKKTNTFSSLFFTFLTFLTFLLLSSFLFSRTLFSQGTSVLLKEKGGDVDFSQELGQRKKLHLDDPFLIQLYGHWKALGPLSPEGNAWLQLLFEGEKKKAFLSYHKRPLKDPKLSSLKTPIELYLLYKLGYFQTFLERWIDYSAHSHFLDTELAQALDQVLGDQSSLILLQQGFFFDRVKEEKLSLFEKKSLGLNHSLQAYKILQRKKGLSEKPSGTPSLLLETMGKLSSKDELRQHLAYSVVLDYAKRGELGASGKMISQVIEPWIQKSKKTEEVSHYYMTLARLLYQARAYKESLSFYYRIPDSSRYFLEARTEALWALLQERDFSLAKGQLETLKMSIFSEQFYPEIFVVQAIGHTMLCQFIEAQKAIESFIQSNRSWVRKIDLALAPSQKEIPMIYENFYVQGMRKRERALKKERENLERLGVNSYSFVLGENIRVGKDLLKKEARLQWESRQKILEDALYKMKFVRLELLSRMRSVAMGMKGNFKGAENSLYREAKVREEHNEMLFPNDGLLWGDELFKMSARVHNMCVEGKFYAKN